MEPSTTCESYPLSTIAKSNLVSLLIYLSGCFIMYMAGWIFAVVFFLYIMALEYRLLRYHCTNCFYWGKACGFGRGTISAFFFKKGATSKFNEKKMTWKDMIPDILVTAIPVVTGFILLIFDFRFSVLIAMFLLVALSTVGTGHIRGDLTCRYCKQREIGCPASDLFKQGK